MNDVTTPSIRLLCPEPYVLVSKITWCHLRMFPKTQLKFRKKCLFFTFSLCTQTHKVGLTLVTTQQKMHVTMTNNRVLRHLRHTIHFSNIWPELKCPIVWTRRNPFAVVRNVTSHQSTVVTFQRRQRLPCFCRPQLGSVVVGRRQHVFPVILLVNDVRYDVCMSRNCVLNISFSQVPHFARVVHWTGEDVVPVGWPVDADDAFEVAFEEHDALAGSKVPNAAEGVHSSRRC